MKTLKGSDLEKIRDEMESMSIGGEELDDDQLYGKIEALMDIFEDLPDGAYFAALEEHGVGIDEVVWYEEEKQRHKKHKK